jgi:hypothetical protein
VPDEVAYRCSSLDCTDWIENPKFNSIDETGCLHSDNQFQRESGFFCLSPGKSAPPGHYLIEIGRDLSLLDVHFIRFKDGTETAAVALVSSNPVQIPFGISFGTEKLRN